MLGCNTLHSGTSKTKELVPSPARLSFVLKVPLGFLRPSIIYSVPSDRTCKGPIKATNMGRWILPHRLFYRNLNREITLR